MGSPQIFRSLQRISSECRQIAIRNVLQTQQLRSEPWKESADVRPCETRRRPPLVFVGPLQLYIGRRFSTACDLHSESCAILVWHRRRRLPVNVVYFGHTINTHIPPTAWSRGDTEFTVPINISFSLQTSGPPARPAWKCRLLNSCLAWKTHLARRRPDWWRPLFSCSGWTRHSNRGQFKHICINWKKKTKWHWFCKRR